MAPEHIAPNQLPDPWTLDTETLLQELGRIRQLALLIPANRHELIAPTNTVIDALWALEENLRYCYSLHCERQRSWARRAAETSKRQTKPLEKPTAAQPVHAHRRA